MSVNLQPIFTQTVGAGGVASITFNNIPQTFTDLKILASIRTNRASLSYDSFYLTFNGNGSNYSLTSARGSGSSASSYRNSALSSMNGPVTADAATATSNTFGNMEIYVPNYTGSNYKSVLIDGVDENNATEAYQEISAGLWSNTSAITSVTIGGYNGNLVQYSTFSLYGILRQGV